MDRIDEIIQNALKEDLGPGDKTTEAVIPSDLYGRARIIARETLVLAGIDIARKTFQLVDPAVELKKLCDDGTLLEKDRPIAEVSGRVESLLKAERTALNFLQHLSGIATITHRFVEAVKGHNVKIFDTRKTLPGLRVMEKYAVRVGGGFNHRMGAYDGFLIKDNHIAACGGIAEAVKRGKQNLPHYMKLEVETKSLVEVEEALEAGADVILLDNMTPETIEAAVSLAQGKAFLEASGGIRLENIRDVAKTGVNAISIGALTHSVRAVDISMEFLT